MTTEEYVTWVKDKLSIFKKFNFEEGPHKYWWLDENGEQVFATTSMTSLIHDYTNPFDADAMAPKTAKKMGIPVDEVLAMWKYNNEFAKLKGTYIHAYNEYLWGNMGEYQYDKQQVKDMFGRDVIEDVWDKLTKISNSFFEQYNDRLIPIGLELVVGDEEIKICGSVDFLCYSYKLQSLIIVDYKSNKEIKTEAFKNQKMLGILSHLEDCNYIHYSLQLNGYQYIIQKKTGLALNNQHFLIWINEKNDDFYIYQTKDLLKEARMILEGKE